MAESTSPSSTSTQGKVKMRMLEFELTKGGTTEYTLEDGTVVRLTPNLNQALVQIDENGKPLLRPQGIPNYHFSFGIQSQIIPKDRTLYIPKPKGSPVGSPPSTMTV